MKEATKHGKRLQTLGQRFVEARNTGALYDCLVDPVTNLLAIAMKLGMLAIIAEKRGEQEALTQLWLDFDLVCGDIEELLEIK